MCSQVTILEASCGSQLLRAAHFIFPLQAYEAPHLQVHMARLRHNQRAHCISISASGWWGGWQRTRMSCTSGCWGISLIMSSINHHLMGEAPARLQATRRAEMKGQGWWGKVEGAWRWPAVERLSTRPPLPSSPLPCGAAATAVAPSPSLLQARIYLP